MQQRASKNCTLQRTRGDQAFNERFKQHVRAFASSLFASLIAMLHFVCHGCVQELCRAAAMLPVSELVQYNDNGTIS
eukprot:28690-Eustigmatos_ZCMA.PRE.1